MNQRTSKTAVIVYKSLPHYRVDFYNQLRVALSEQNIDLRLIVGRPYGAEAAKNDEGEVAWAEYVRNRVVPIGGRTLVWQPVLKQVRHADLVIVEQANKALVNLVLMVWRKFGGPKLGLWGHGYNHDPATASGLSETLKRWVIRRCDWWFAYTGSTARYVAACGVPDKKITTVQNAIDTTTLASLRQSITSGDIERERTRLGVVSDNVGIFVGSLYEAKRLPFLIECCDEIRRRVPDFEMLVVGDGPQRAIVQDAARLRPWLHCLGVLKGIELVRAASLAKVMLMPGLVGLVILDAFALQTPLVATQVDNHSPEIDYLEPGVNGLLVSETESPSAYAEAVRAVLSDSTTARRLAEGCALSASRYTVEEMVKNFSAGIEACVSAQ